MNTYAQQYNFHVRRINNLRNAIDDINSSTLGELGKLTKAEKAEKKRLQRIEKAERKALYKLTSKKERKRISKQAMKARKRLKSATGFSGDLNKAGPVTLPLTEQEEIFRQASAAGDFLAMDQLVPFGPNNWGGKTPIGKYRFVIQNGKPVYIPYSETDFDNFLSGPWFVRDPATGLAPLIHPRRKRAVDFIGKKKKYVGYQARAANRFPNTDYRHIIQMYPGEYQIGHGIKSTWVKVRTPVVVAVAVVAAVYLGPAIVAKVKALGGTATGGVATTEGAATSAKVFAGAQKLTDYVNNARTIEAIANGEMPPPPITISGSNFTDWAMIEAEEKFMEDMQRKMTQDEERQMRREIEAMQRELESIIPSGVPIEPSPELNTTVKQMQVIEENKAANVNKMLQFALPAAIGFLVLKGFA